MIASLYFGLSCAIRPLLPLWLSRRLKKGKEDGTRLGERFGRSALARPEGKLLWVHGASVGETLSAFPLLGPLLEANPELSIMVTSGTRTSAEMLAQKLPERAFHQFIPFDSPDCVNRFLTHWHPDAVLWLESDLWPNLLKAIKRRHIPAALVNARVSLRSASRWRFAKGFSRQLFSTFSVILPQSQTDLERLKTLGAKNLAYVGNLKLTAPAPAFDLNRLERLKLTLGARPCWMMASTHPGEEAIALAVHDLLAPKWPDLLTLIVPRHLSRMDEIRALMQGRTVAWRSEGAMPTRETNLYVADTFGEMGTLYRAAPIACVGASFTPKGGHNPIEPAACGAAVLCGPDMSNCLDLMAVLTQAKAVEQVANAAQLAAAIDRLFASPDELARRQKAGLEATSHQADILDAAFKALAPVITALDIGHIVLPVANKTSPKALYHADSNA